MSDEKTEAKRGTRGTEGRDEREGKQVTNDELANMMRDGFEHMFGLVGDLSGRLGAIEGRMGNVERDVYGQSNPPPPVPSSLLGVVASKPTPVRIIAKTTDHSEKIDSLSAEVVKNSGQLAKLLEVNKKQSKEAFGLGDEGEVSPLKRVLRNPWTKDMIRLAILILGLLGYIQTKQTSRDVQTLPTIGIEGKRP
jgi:hypothetical protein